MALLIRRPSPGLDFGGATKRDARFVSSFVGRFDMIIAGFLTIREAAKYLNPKTAAKAGFGLLAILEARKLSGGMVALYAWWFPPFQDL